jgi:hypothetical protein
MNLKNYIPYHHRLIQVYNCKYPANNNNNNNKAGSKMYL